MAAPVLGEKEKGMSSTSFPSRPGWKIGARFVCALSLSVAAAAAKSDKRCDWHGPLSASESPFVKCVDFASLNGKEMTLPRNVTRISADGLSFCATKTSVSGPSEADIVFIYDNSGSMTPDMAYIDAAAKDTSFLYRENSNTCDNHKASGQMTYRIRNGSTRTLDLIDNNNGCASSQAGDPYFARGEVIKDGIDFLAQTSPTSTAGVMSFNDIVRYAHEPVPVSDKAKVADVKATITLEEDGTTNYRPPLAKAKQWLNDAALIKTKKQAIVFISDGAPKDSYLNVVDDAMPPIYSIYLARAATPDTANLRDLSDRTGGTFTRVNPNDPNAIDLVLKQIITAITTNPGSPKTATITNKSLSPPQVSHTTGVTANPDGSTGMRLDSIVALDSGRNVIEIQLTRDDNTTATYAFTMNVSGGEASSTGGNYSCYDMPTLTAIDKATGQPPELYSPEKTSYDLRLTRSPSDLGAVSALGTSPDNDRETIALGAPDLSSGIPTHTAPFRYDPAKAAAAANNGILEVSDHGDLTFAWSHPRDRRETVSYVLPGRIVPVLSGRPAVEWVNVLGKDSQGDKVPVNPDPKSQVILVDAAGKCVVNCKDNDPYRGSTEIPTLKLIIRSPVRFEGSVFDNFGQFVNQWNGVLDSAAWNRLSKSGDSAEIYLRIKPFSKSGQTLATGAYILKLDIRALGDQVTHGADGESIVVKNAHREYVSRFGYLRGH